MKKILLASALFLAVNFAQAQEGTTVERATAKTEKLTQVASLNADQVEKVQVVFEGIEMKNDGISNDATLSAEQKAEILKSNKDAEASMLENILTADQFQKYKSMNQPKGTFKATKTETKAIEKKQN